MKTLVWWWLEEKSGTHLWPHLLQGVKGSDIWVCHGSSDWDAKQETCLNVTGEIKTWRPDSRVSLWDNKCMLCLNIIQLALWWSGTSLEHDDSPHPRHSPPMCVYREAVTPPSGPWALLRPSSSSFLLGPAAMRKRAALLHTRLTTYHRQAARFLPYYS